MIHTAGAHYVVDKGIRTSLVLAGGIHLPDGQNSYRYHHHETGHDVRFCFQNPNLEHLSLETLQLPYLHRKHPINLALAVMSRAEFLFGRHHCWESIMWVLLLFSHIALLGYPPISTKHLSIFLPLLFSRVHVTLYVTQLVGWSVWYVRSSRNFSKKS